MVCTYNHVIPEIVCATLERGLHTFSEKPPGRSVADVQLMMVAEKKAGDRILKFGFNHRFHYGVMEAKAIVDSGRYGKLLWARGIYGKAGGLTFENSWRSDKNLSGGGILLDQGIHMVDLLRYFLGDFKEVKSYVQNCYWEGIPVEDNAFALMKTNDDKVAMMHSSATQWKHKFSLDLFMTDGYLCINGILSSTRSYGEESITFARKQFENETAAMGKPREEIIYFDRDDSWKHELDEFYKCIKDKKSVTMGSSTDALRVMELIEKIYEADKE
jgi:predicted dehydrogenase